jgi:phosphatidylglycerol---prolipoprotein diacylglyceryl transferase
MAAAAALSALAAGLASAAFGYMTHPEVFPAYIFSFDWGGKTVGLRFYTLFYVGGFGLAWALFQGYRKQGWLPLTFRESIGFILTLFGCVVLMSHWTYLVVYNPWSLKADPWRLLVPFHGHSFHGGLMGAALGAWVYARWRHKPFAALGDAAALAGPVGLGFGRLGNFMNGELYGRVTDVPWAMRFVDRVNGGLTEPRHPSQLYQSLTEGFLVAALAAWFSRGRRGDGLASGVFLLGYGVARWLVEFTREPDPQLGFIFGPLTMGQLLCSVMIVVGTVVLLRVGPRRAASATAPATGLAGRAKKKRPTSRTAGR